MNKEEPKKIVIKREDFLLEKEWLEKMQANVEVRAAMQRFADSMVKPYLPFIQEAAKKLETLLPLMNQTVNSPSFRLGLDAWIDAQKRMQEATKSFNEMLKLPELQATDFSKKTEMLVLAKPVYITRNEAKIIAEETITSYAEKRLAETAASKKPILQDLQPVKKITFIRPKDEALKYTVFVNEAYLHPLKVDIKGKGWSLLFRLAEKERIYKKLPSDYKYEVDFFQNEHSQLYTQTNTKPTKIIGSENKYLTALVDLEIIKESVLKRRRNQLKAA